MNNAQLLEHINYCFRILALAIIAIWRYIRPGQSISTPLEDADKAVRNIEEQLHGMAQRPATPPPAPPNAGPLPDEWEIDEPTEAEIEQEAIALWRLYMNVQRDDWAGLEGDVKNVWRDVSRQSFARQRDRIAEHVQRANSAHLAVIRHERAEHAEALKRARHDGWTERDFEANDDYLRGFDDARKEAEELVKQGHGDCEQCARPLLARDAVRDYKSVVKELDKVRKDRDDLKTQLEMVKARQGFNVAGLPAERDDLALKLAAVTAERDDLASDCETLGRDLEEAANARDKAIAERNETSTSRGRKMQRLHDLMGSKPGEDIEDAAHDLVVERDGLKFQLDALNDPISGIATSLKRVEAERDRWKERAQTLERRNDAIREIVEGTREP